MKYRCFRPATRLSACATVLALAACGGGGDGGDSATPAPNIKSVDVAAFTHNRLRANATWTMNGTGTANGQSVPVQITLSAAPGAQAAYPITGVTGNTTSQTLTISSSGVSNSVVRTFYYDDADHVFGASYSVGGCTSIAASTTALPTTAAIGASGPLQAEESYAGCLAAPAMAPVATVNETWSVENDGGVVLVCENSTQGGGSSVSTGSTCIESDTNGKLGSRARMTLSSGGVTISVRNY